DELIAFAQNRINYRPKKCLKFKQPAVVFQQFVS
ncbi:MAG: IS30 family transposase, partial [Clostridium sp.]